ncbi:MAG: glycosyltransferase [Bacteroidetes bacterium]|nr:glycosyltransferase [Bacteroidota bacterium]
MRIFVILSRIPYPLEKGDKVRVFNQIKWLSKKHEIILVALDDAKINKQDAFRFLQPYCRSVNFIDLSITHRFINLLKVLFSKKPFQVGYFYSKKAHKKINQLIKEKKPDHIYCQLIRVAEYVRDLEIPKTLDYQDAFSKGVEQRIKNSSFIKKIFLKEEFNRLVKYENSIFQFFDNKTIISESDRRLIEHPQNNEIEIISNGIDQQYFRPMPVKKEYDLLFTGNMSYPPNIESAEYLVKKILPALQLSGYNLKVLIAGVDPHKKIKSLKSSSVTICGWVEDMRKCYAKSLIFIAPMQSGIGLQNKLLEAMAMKIPCITSSLANQSLGAKPETEILIGDQTGDYVNHILTILKNKDGSEKLAANGFNFVSEKYQWETAIDKLESLITSTNKRD